MEFYILFQISFTSIKEHSVKTQQYQPATQGEYCQEHHNHNYRHDHECAPCCGCVRTKVVLHQMNSSVRSCSSLQAMDAAENELEVAIGYEHALIRMHLHATVSGVSYDGGLALTSDFFCVQGFR